MTEEAPLEYRKEWARLRSLLIDTSMTYLATDPRDGHRWLTDMYVLLRVTDSIACKQAVVDLAVDWPDGEYNVSASKGLTDTKRAQAFDAMAYLNRVESGHPSWAPVRATGWSLSDSAIKAMLVYSQHDDGRRVPMLVAEPVWKAFGKHYEGCGFEAARSNGRNVFRVAHDGEFVAYVAGGIVKPGHRHVAKGIIGRLHA